MWLRQSGNTCENVLAKSTKVYYNYDNLNRVTNRTVRSSCDNSVISNEDFTYDAAGNITDAPGSCYRYDTNNRLTIFKGHPLSDDLDGNMLTSDVTLFTYDSANRLIKAGYHTYTYNAEDVRIRDFCCGSGTIYTYNTNCELGQLLMKTTGTTVTKYVYGCGLIGEETGGAFKTYHFDYRGSTVAITDACGNVTDTFEYDTYGKLTGRTGTSEVIFGYNGRDGVITDDNGLIYMRARYYSPDMKRFINADVIAGDISNAVTLNRFAYANGNPVSLVDPFGMSAERGSSASSDFWSGVSYTYDRLMDAMEVWGWGVDTYDFFKHGFRLVRKGNNIIVKGARTAAAVRRGIAGTKYSLSNAGKYWDILGGVNVSASLKSEFSLFKPTGRGISKINGNAILNYAGILLTAGVGVAENIEAGTRTQKIVSDAIVDVAVESVIVATSTAAGSVVGSFIPIPVVGTVVGAAAGYVAGELVDIAVNADIFGGKSAVDWAKEGAAIVADGLVDAGKASGEAIADAWEATTDFVEDAGEWIADTASDAWDATTDFFEDAGNVVGNFFAGIFG